MKEFKLDENEEVNQAEGALPAKVGVWAKIKGFLFQEIDLNKPIVLELTPKEEKVLNEVHDFQNYMTSYFKKFISLEKRTKNNYNIRIGLINRKSIDLLYSFYFFQYLLINFNNCDITISV